MGVQVKSGVRYIRDWINGSEKNGGNHWVELRAFDENGTNVALNKPVMLESGEYGAKQVTDGTLVGYHSGVGGKSFVTVDLTGLFSIAEIKVWHFYTDGRKYLETKTEVSSDGVNWVPVFDSATEGEYAESLEGHSIQVEESDVMKDIDSITVWDGLRHRNVIGSVMTVEGLKSFYKPALSFMDNNDKQNGLIKAGSTAKVSSGKMLFDTLYKYDVSAVGVRYIRDWINGSEKNASNHWVEIRAFDENGTNVALNKPVMLESGEYGAKAVTDGTLDVHYDGGSGKKFVVVDLLDVFSVIEIKVWHFYKGGRTYNDSKTEVSSDGVNWFTIFDSEVDGRYAESSTGNKITVPLKYK